MPKNKKSRKWEIKNEEIKEYKTLHGQTDYNIPMFGYKSALFIMGVETIIVIILVLIAELFKINYKYLILLFVPVTFSTLVAYSQFFIERKKGITKYFILTIILLTILFTIIFYLLLFKNILI